jgi:hypothetical protein
MSNVLVKRPDDPMTKLPIQSVVWS